MSDWDGTIPEDLTPPPAGHAAAGMVIGAAWESGDTSTEDAKPRFPDPFAT